MKKKILLILPVLILVVILIIIAFKPKNSVMKDFNTDVTISTTENKINSNIQTMSSEDYEIDSINTKTLSAEEEEKVLKTATDITKAFNEIERDNYVHEIEKYAVRAPSIRLDKDDIAHPDYKEWFNNILTVEVYANYFRGRNATYETLKGLKITYVSTERILVKAFLDNYSLTFGSATYKLDAIFEYTIVYEEASKLYKVKSMTIEWVSDLEKYYQKMETEERNQNKNNTTTVSNVSSYIPEGYTNFDYSKLKKVTSEETKAIYDKTKDSVVIIDSVSEGGVTAGSASGFFVRKGIIATAYDSIYRMIENGAARYYAVDSNEKTTEISGIVAAYPELNIVLLKTKEESGTPVIIGNPSKLEKNNPVAVISSSLGLKSSIKMGIYFDTLNDDYNVIRTALPLINGDTGSALFNMNGEVIGINTSVSTSQSEYNSGLNNAVDINILIEIITKLRNEKFNKIKIIDFKEFNEDTKIKVVNKVDKKVWKKYEELPIVTKQLPLNLYSAYQTEKYLIIRYKQDKYTALTNENVIDLYEKNLTSNSYEQIKENVYKKDNIIIRIQNNLGYIIVIVEGVV